MTSVQSFKLNKHGFYSSFFYSGKLGEHIISVGADNFHILHGAEVEEVRGPVNLMVELFGIEQL